MYCGDGLNDLVALAAADVGVSVGTGDAAAGASISIHQPSIAGTVLAAGLCHLPILLKHVSVCLSTCMPCLDVYQRTYGSLGRNLCCEAVAVCRRHANIVTQQRPSSADI